jgi:hypothetical protein
MRPELAPLRLSQTEPYGDALRELSRQQVSPERIAENALRLKAQLAALPAAGAGASATATATAHLGTVAKVLLPIAVTASGIVGYRAMIDPQRTTVTDAAPRTPIRAQAEPAPEAPTLAPPPALAPTPPETHIDPPPPPRPHRVAKQPRSLTEPTPLPAPTRAEVSSDLPEQIELLAQAKRSAAASHFPAALATLEQLAQRFPTSPLRAEADLYRIEWLIAAGHKAEASDAIPRLLADSAHAGRRAELYRLQSELLLQLGRCGAAAGAYNRATAAGLAETEAQVLRNGLEQCVPR